MIRSVVAMDDGYRTLYGEASDRIKPTLILQGMHNAPAAWIGIEHRLTGPNLTYSMACSSSGVAIGEAWLRVASGAIDLAVAGGSEAPLALGSMKAWEAMHTLASNDVAAPSASCKPFSKNRSGMVLGEGAAIVLLEPMDVALARNATIHGELIGYGLTTDSSHIARPSAQGQACAMYAALRSASITADEVDSINAHGTGTLANDAAETAAIRSVFGDRAGVIRSARRRRSSGICWALPGLSNACWRCWRCGTASHSRRCISSSPTLNAISTTSPTSPGRVQPGTSCCRTRSPSAEPTPCSCCGRVSDFSSISR